MSTYIRYPNLGVATYATLADFPTSASNGTLALALDTDVLYAFNTGSSSWVALGGATSVLSIGAIDSNGAAVNGASINLNNLIMQSASATRPGLMNNAAQTLSGIKTFNSAIIVPGGVDSAPAGTVNIATANANITNIGRSGGTVNILGTTLYENVTNLQVADKLIGLNIGGGAGTAFGSGIELEENAIITAYVKTSIDRNSWTLLAPNTVGVATITPGISGITVDQSSHNPVTLGTANGLSLSTQVLSLQLSDATHTGALSSADWSTFNSKQAAGSFITALTGDATASGPGSAALTLATVNAGVGSFGSASQSLAITANAKGLITAIAAQSIQIAESQVTGLVADLASKVATASLGDLTDVGTDGIVVTGGTGAVVGSVSLAQHVSDSTHNGYLSSVDWSTFNGKQAAGSYITALTGDVTAAGPNSAVASISNATVTGKLLTGYVSGAGVVAATDSILQAIQKLNGNAATGLSSTLTNAHLYVGNGSNVATDVAVSGDLTLANTGAFTIANSAVSNAKLANMASSTVKANVTGGAAAPTDVAFVSTNTNNSGVFRDGSGNFAANTITANLTGTASNATLAVDFSGSLSGEVSGGQSSTVLSTAAVIGKGLTGFVSGAGNVTSADSILTGLQKINGNDLLKAPIASPTFTGVVTMPTPFTLGATSVTSTGTQLNYLNAATGTTGTASTNLVYSTSPVLVTPNLGTPTTLVGTNITGTASGLTAGTVTTNANLTGDITSSGNATTAAATQPNIATLSKAAGVAVHGTNTNDNASAGYVGEHLYQNTLRASPNNISNGGTINVLGTPLTLTAGDWDLTGFIGFHGTSAVVTQVQANATTTSATIGSTPPSNDMSITDARDGCVASASQSTGFDLSGGCDLVLTMAPMRVTLSGSQTIYLAATANFNVGTVLAYGRLDARRVR